VHPVLKYQTYWTWMKDLPWTHCIHNQKFIINDFKIAFVFLGSPRCYQHLFHNFVYFWYFVVDFVQYFFYVDEEKL